MTATTTPTLTERYIAAVVRRLPEKSRADVATELRASLADDIEARTAAGLAPEAAEREALVALGDPDRLAAGYAGTPLHLIGPTLYLDWRRLLTVLLSIVLPVTAGGLVLARALAGDDPGEIVLGTAGTLVSVAIGLTFWVTTVFAIIERTGAGDRPLVAWRPESLPPGDGKPQVGVDVLVGGVLGLVLLVALLAAQTAWPVFRDDDGAPVPFLHPDLWSFWVPYFVVVLAAELVFSIVLYQRRRWSLGLAVANIVITLASAVPLIALIVSDSVVNPAFSARLADSEGLVTLGQQGSVVAAIAIGAVALWECVDGVIKAGRAARGA